METVSVDLRSYAQERPRERHGFVQLVFPVSGQLEIDVCGLQERLSPSRGVLIHSGALHTQQGEGPNRSLIVDMEEAKVSPKILDTFSSSPFIDLNRTTLRLIHHMRQIMQTHARQLARDSLLARILVENLVEDSPDIISRLSVLKALVELEPFMPWSLERMAHQADISVSRLHAIFREQFDQTPHLWLSDIRMKKICALLASSTLPIAEIADKAGFSDQTALTRAMKKAMGTTPAVYRREFSPLPQ
ncbi:putative AraC family transcriptional regulator [Agrobacterium rubi TR3 = NBRC 13261]|uniref:Putative AraC family transcriptional regulator n=1 Tax=Agrobacterium rubi TR3 = NBRC 13261 TaxID=1368415 RepID=A0A081CW27_9HYPH|nr:AraC family transcriptional regulator [Agrobacterium rubi]MBP1877837.1 AraC-like DNA-binding protein [Agrobacterium rubi]MCL6651976.1 AraC family transcriptional regulator [Agrobacterium rubi]GAK70873.1 putative AraC family transcriptional regulator [Agrobacterium rubi TR3 = NBRC 13261]